jgi:tRNA pseudouridine38-40 synthase
MNRYKVVIAYDGTDFHGWQIQPFDITVVSTLQKSFIRAFSKTVSIVGASRTDAGVHALGQVAVCRTDLNLDPTSICEAWNHRLPKSILVRSVEKVDDSFHIFADVVQKTYLYHLFYRRPLPFIARYGWLWKFIDKVDFEKFDRALQCFVGEHDFRSFCKNECNESTIRKVDFITMRKFSRYGVVQISVKGKGFLRYQIRRMIGAALDVASEDYSVDVIVYHIKNPSDQQKFTKAKASGLCLRKIIYRSV